ncbi:hypothetical protein KXD40_002519 [Peronospora effusa]|uniref:Uncharacterized protein n=1 Tax=Peronospora effusa TaxID=542832 RepID=A0A3M6V798_9STRA|nr:hypothetical protein DD238_005190 [Peronospora effusa]RQM09977.1 hypothetical protein DD237_006052 [Peronospora effusa]UIZ26419.1 hypothetical protein KXD40_002519 [Peronospora effusa]
MSRFVQTQEAVTTRQVVNHLMKVDAALTAMLKLLGPSVRAIVQAYLERHHFDQSHGIPSEQEVAAPLLPRHFLYFLGFDGLDMDHTSNY